MTRIQHNSNNNPDDVYEETVSGSETSWTLQLRPVNGTLQLFSDVTSGGLLRINVDYTITGKSITTSDSLLWLSAKYKCL